MKVGRVILLMLMMIAFSSISLASDLLTALTQAQQYGLTHRIDYHALQAEIAQSNLAKALFLPKVALTVGLSSINRYHGDSQKIPGQWDLTTRINSADIGIIAQQPLFDLHAWHIVLASNQLKHIATINYHLQQMLFYQQIITIYLGAVLADNLHALAQSHLAIMRTTYNSIRHINKADANRAVDISFARSSLYTAKAKALQSLSAKHNTLQLLQAVTNAPISSINLFKSYHHIKFPRLRSKSYYLKTAHQYNPYIQLAEYHSVILQQKLAASKAERYPAINAVGVFTMGHGNNLILLTQDSGDVLPHPSQVSGGHSFVAVTANVPIFTGGYLSNQIKSDYENYQKSLLQLHQAIDDISSKTKIDYYNTIHARKQIQANYLAMKAHKITFKILVQHYLTKKTNLVQAFVAEQTLILASVAFDSSEHAYFQAFTNLQLDINALSPRSVRTINRALTRSKRRRQLPAI